MNRTITVKGIGKVKTKPDYIHITLTLQTQELEYDTTMEKAAVVLDNLRYSLMKIGFQKEDLKTSDFNVQTAYENERGRDGNYVRRFKGYVCRHVLQLAFDFDMDRLSLALATIAKSLSEPQLSIQFTVKDKDAVAAELLKSASENARAKAKILTEASGVKLGELVTIDYNWGELQLYSPTQYAMEDRCLASAPCASSIDIEPDDIESSDSVTFVWTLS